MQIDLNMWLAGARVLQLAPGQHLCQSEGRLSAECAQCHRHLLETKSQGPDKAIRFSKFRNELSRFATQHSWTWFSMVFIFFLLSGCCTTAYWLLHYEMPSKQEIEKYGKNAPKVFGFSKLDFKRMVRNAGALFAMCQLGTAFAAWRALRTNDLRQRKAEMDLRGGEVRRSNSVDPSL